MADQQEPSGFFRSITPTVWVSIFAALLSVIGALTVALINASAQREVALSNAAAQRTLEREQFESNLILKAIGSGDKKSIYNSLRILVEGGFIRRESDKVSRLLQDTSFHFHIPKDKPVAQLPRQSRSFSSYSELYPTTSFSGIVLDDATGQPLGGVTVSIETNRSRPRVAESQITGSDGLFTLHYPPRYFTINYTLSGYVEQSTEHEVTTRFKGPLIVRLKGLRAYHY